MIKILTVTGSRSEYDILYPLLKKIDNHKKLELTILLCGSHLNKNFGKTISYVKLDRFKNLIKLKSIFKNQNGNIQIFNSYNYVSKAISKILIKKKIDLLLILGDRFEAHAASIAAFFLKKKIIHIGGGDTSLGSMDEYFRNSISLMSDLHFPKIFKHKDKLINLGVKANKIYPVGSLSNENYLRVFEKFFFVKEPFALVTFHPVTNSKFKKDNNIEILIKALATQKDLKFLFTASNHDAGGKEINDTIKKYTKKDKRFIYVPNLGRKLYYQAMNNCEFMIGNSSSGIVESMIYKKPSINILPRQLGRKGNKNIIHCKNDYLSIIKSIKKVKSDNFKKKCNNLNNIFLKNDRKPSQIIIEKILKNYV